MPFGLEIKDLVNVAVGVVVTIVFGYFFLHMGFRRKQLIFTGRSQQIMWSQPEGLEVRYKGTLVKSLTRFTVCIWNAGNEAITKADLKTKDALRLDVYDGVEVLQKEVAYQSRPANNAAIKGDHVTFDYLNSGDGIVVEFFLDRKEKYVYPRDRKVIELHGEIIGASKPPQRVEFDAASWSYGGKAFAICFGFIFIYLGASTCLDVVRSAPFWELIYQWRPVAKFTVSLIGACGGVAIVAYSVWRMATVHKLPKDLSVSRRISAYEHGIHPEMLVQ
jgi:hypothetical protein